MALKPESLLAHADFVRALARSLVLDEHRADDVVQETWIAALERPPGLGGNLRSWLGTVVRNFAFIARRSETRRTLRERAAAKRERIDSTEKIVEWESVRRRVVEAVLNLEEPYRTAVVLRFYDGLPPREIAKRLEIPVETAKTRLKRGLALLRERLDKQHGGDGRAWTFALTPLAGIKAGILTTGFSTTLTGVLAMSAKIKAGAITAMILAAAAVFIAVIDNELRQTSQGAAEERSSTVENTTRKPRPEGKEASSPEEAPPVSAATTPTRENVLPSKGGKIELVGRVIDDQGQALEGAMVQQAYRKFWSSGRRLTTNFKWNDSDILTGSDGAFSLLLPRDDVAGTWLNIQKSGYELSEAVPAIKAVTRPDGALDLGDIKIYPALSIRGRVIDEKGNPVPGCRVSALGSPWHEGDRYIEITDKDGRFHQVFPNIEWGTDHLVKAFKEGCGVGWSPCPEPALHDAAPEVTITLHPCSAISGRLLNGDGSVAKGMRLSANCTFPRMKMGLSIRTNKEGHFRFYPTPEGTYALRAYPPGYFDEEDGWGVVLDKDVAAGREGLTFRLPPLARLELYFTDDSGDPVSGETPSVSLWRTRDDPLYRQLGSSTGFDLGEVAQMDPGRFRISNVSPGIYRIGCYFDEYDYHVFEDVTVPAKMETVRLEAALIKKPMILGRVFHADGRPAKGIKLVCSQSHPYPDQSSREVPFTPYGLRMASGRMTDPKTEVTDEEGRFRFHAFPNWGSKNNQFHVQVFLENRVVLHESPIELTRDHPQKVLTFTLPVGRGCTGTIEGLIRDARGNALGNALVVAWDGKDLFYRTRSDEEGQYSFTAMPDGRYIVDGRALTTSLKRTTPIGNRKWLRKGYEDLEKLDPFNAIITNGAASRCDLIVQDPWNGSISGSLAWASRPAPLDFEADIHAVDSKGGQKYYDDDYERPTAGDLFSFIFRAMRDENPRKDAFLFDDLQAGRYRISILGKGYDAEGNYFRCPMTSAEVVLEPSEQRELTLDLKIASLQGRVLDQETGEPVAGAQIGMSLQPPAWWHQQGLWFTTRNDGTFEGTAVPAGTYAIRIMHDNHAEIRDRGLELFSNEHKRDIEFFLEPPNTLEGLLDRKDKSGEKIRYTIRLEVEKWGDRHVYCELSDDDRFIMKNLPAGPVKVIIRGPNKFELTRSVVLPPVEEDKLVIEVP